MSPNNKFSHERSAPLYGDDIVQSNGNKNHLKLRIKSLNGNINAPDFTADTGTGKIPWLFSRKAIVKFYDESVLPVWGRISVS